MKDFMQENMDEFLPLREVVFKTLRQSILTGELKPGERLMEIHLAEKLGVSRTPIREAIRKLELEGLVTMITDEQIADLKKACDDFVLATKTGEATAITKADVRLHDVIVRATGNERLQQMINTLSEQMYRYRFEYIKDSAYHALLIEEHRRIYESIASRDEERAVAEITQHIENQLYTIRKHLHFTE